jgi:hypothetical protein
MAENRQEYTSRVAPGLDLAIQAEQAEWLPPWPELVKDE